MAKTLFIGQNVHLSNMNIFDIGGNKDHINFGLMSSQVVKSLSPKINSLSKDIENLAVPGYVLDLLEENDDETLNTLKSFVKENNVNLLALPYYNSSLSLLSKEELSKQLNLQEKTHKKIFNKSSSGFFCTDGIIPKHAKDSLSSYSTIINPSKTDSTVSYIGDVQKPSFNSFDSRMEFHLSEELQNMYPKIVSFGDKETLTSWRYLTQSSVISRADVSKHANDAYEHYMNVMNVLNDMAHKIRNVNLVKKGLFQEKPIISETPSKIIITD